MINYELQLNKQDMTGRLACTCECGNYFQEGEFKNCPCGCGQVVEIIDDSNHYSEPRLIT